MNFLRPFEPAPSKPWLPHNYFSETRGLSSSFIRKKKQWSHYVRLYIQYPFLTLSNSQNFLIKGRYINRVLKPRFSEVSPSFQFQALPCGRSTDINLDRNTPVGLGSSVFVQTRSRLEKYHCGNSPSLEGSHCPTPSRTRETNINWKKVFPPPRQTIRIQR